MCGGGALVPGAVRVSDCISRPPGLLQTPISHDQALRAGDAATARRFHCHPAGLDWMSEMEQRLAPVDVFFDRFAAVVAQLDRLGRAGSRLRGQVSLRLGSADSVPTNSGDQSSSRDAPEAWLEIDKVSVSSLALASLSHHVLRIFTDLTHTQCV